MCTFVSVYVCFFFPVCFSSITYRWLSKSLFLLDTGPFICPTTSCRSCHRTFLPGFHRSSECSCFSWLCTVILECFLPFLDMYLSVFLVWLVSVCACSCVTVCTGRQTDTVTLELRWWRVWRWFALAPHTHIHTRTHKLACLFVCFSDYTGHTSVHFCLYAFLSVPDSWLPDSDSLSLLIQSFIPTSVLVCLCMYLFVLFLFWWVYPTSGCLTLVCVSRDWVLRYCGWVKVLIFYHYLTCICLCFKCCLCVCVFLCHGVHGRQTDTVERLAK
jgi:hypothetical protein